MPLSGVHVVDLTRIYAGPFCTMLLADLGADVIKIEPPDGGDPVRDRASTSTNQLVLRPFQPEQEIHHARPLRGGRQDILDRLIARADVLIENYRPDVLESMGFGETRLRRSIPPADRQHLRLRPHRTVCDRPSFDFIAQAMSGYMSVNGRDGQEPMRAATPISDLVAGLYGAFGIACALVSRLGGRSRGQRVESSLVNGLISMMAYLSAQYLATGELPARTGNDHPIAAPYGLYRASDGEVAIAPSTDDVVRRLFRALDIEPMLDRPEFSTYDSRHAHREAVNALIGDRIRAHPAEHWIQHLNRAGVPCGRVADLRAVFSDPQVQAQEMVLEVEHPGHGAVRMTGFPVKLSETPCRVRLPRRSSAPTPRRSWGTSASPPTSPASAPPR